MKRGKVSTSHVRKHAAMQPPPPPASRSQSAPIVHSAVPCQGKNLARVIAGNLSSYIAVGGREVAYDLVLERLNWIMVALEVSTHMHSLRRCNACDCAPQLCVCVRGRAFVYARRQCGLGSHSSSEGSKVGGTVAAISTAGAPG